MKIVGYLFHSEGSVGEKDVEKSKQMILTVGARLGGRVFRFYEEKVGSLLQPFSERTVGRQVFAELEEGDILVVERVAWVLDSAKNGVKLLEELAGRKISLFCIDLGEDIALPSPRQLKVTEGSATLVAKLLQALAQNERPEHGQAIRDAKTKLKKQGKYLGGPVPFGWRLKGANLVENKREQRIIAEIHQLKKENWSYRQIAMRLEKQYKVRLSHAGVRKIMLRSMADEYQHKDR